MKKTKIEFIKQISRGSKKSLFKIPLPYQTLLKYPPNNVSYIQRLIKGPNLDMKFIRPLYALASKLGFDLRSFYYSFKNKNNSTKQQKYLIHAGAFLCDNKRYIADIEAVSNIFPDPYDVKFINIIKKKLCKKNCKKLITWSKYTENQLKKLMPEITNKIITLYPALPKQKQNKINTKNINILFIGTEFYNKGGWEVLESFNRISNKYDVNLRVVSNVPKKIKNKYSSNKKIIFSDLVTRKKLFQEIYPNTDLLIFPTKFEAFGLITLEAFSFGIPVLGSDNPVQRELIQNSDFIINLNENLIDSNGFFNKGPKKKKDIKKIFDETDVKSIQRKLTKILNNRSILIDEGIQKYSEISKGRFSINYRNSKLKKIYEVANNENSNN